MKYGMELTAELEREIEETKKVIRDRASRIEAGMTDIDDCFVSQRCEERGINLCQDKIHLIQNGGCEWFTEYATTDGVLVDARWCDTRFGSRLRVKMPDGSVIWTSASTKKGLAKYGIKRVRCLRPAWFTFRSAGRGMFGVYAGSYVTFPSSVNYATGEAAEDAPVEIKDAE